MVPNHSPVLSFTSLIHPNITLYGITGDSFFLVLDTYGPWYMTAVLEQLSPHFSHLYGHPQSTCGIQKLLFCPLIVCFKRILQLHLRPKRYSKGLYPFPTYFSFYFSSVHFLLFLIYSTATLSNTENMSECVKLPSVVCSCSAHLSLHPALMGRNYLIWSSRCC